MSKKFSEKGYLADVVDKNGVADQVKNQMQDTMKRTKEEIERMDNIHVSSNKMIVTC